MEPEQRRSVLSLSSRDWVEDAACKGLTYIFFGHVSERPQATARREARAKLVCSRCPVFNQCRDYARKNAELGYWAGENEFDRYQIGIISRYMPSNITRIRNRISIQNGYRNQSSESSQAETDMNMDTSGE
jgi:WhiB family redox-sensing transcriptional regulator